jgi:plasmid maintenance system antidote protein VapI
LPEMTLRGLILSRYRSIRAFANDIGWSPQKAARIISGTQTANIEQVVEMSKKLGIDTSEKLVQYFFTPIIYKTQQNNT